MSDPSVYPPAPEPAAAEAHGFSIHTSHRTILLLPLGIYVVLVALVAVGPAVEMGGRYPADPKARIAGTSPLVARGQQVFVSYGCSVCHTQQIRGDERIKVQKGDALVTPVLAPDARFGLDEPSRPEDYAQDDPPLLGTQRTGPDLTGVGDRLPSVLWHYWHLYDPRSVSPDSVMPPYRELFEVTEPPSLFLGVAVVLGLALLFGLLGWMLFGLSPSMFLALALGVGAGLLVVNQCRECLPTAADCTPVEEGIEALPLPSGAKLMATPDAQALAEYVLSLRRPVRKP